MKFVNARTLTINGVLWRKGFAVRLRSYCQGWIASLPLICFPNLFFLSVSFCVIATTLISV